MIRATDIHSLTDFTRNARAYIQQIRDSKSPIALTVNGDAQVVVQDAEAYQELLDRVETIEGLQRGLSDVTAGHTKPARAVFNRLRRKHGIPR